MTLKQIAVGSIALALAAMSPASADAKRSEAAKSTVESIIKKKAKRATQFQSTGRSHLESTVNSQLERREPRFKVEAIGFIARDESGVDWTGSDEVRVIFDSRHSQPTYAVSRKFENVDTGDQRNFGSRERCILPWRAIRNTGDKRVMNAPADQWTCKQAGVAGPIAFTVSMFEDDSELEFWIPPIEFCGPSNPDAGIDCVDDLIGSETISYTIPELLQMMPRVDNTFVGTVTLGGPCGSGNRVCAGWLAATGPEYLFGFRITRLPDRIVPPQRSQY